MMPHKESETRQYYSVCPGGAMRIFNQYSFYTMRVCDEMIIIIVQCLVIFLMFHHNVNAIVQ